MNSLKERGSLLGKSRKCHYLPTEEQLIILFQCCRANHCRIPRFMGSNYPVLFCCLLNIGRCTVACGLRNGSQRKSLLLQGVFGLRRSPTLVPQVTMCIVAISTSERFTQGI